MKKVLLTAAAAVMLSTSAMAADLKMPAKAAPAAPPSPWDIAFGGYIASDYIWRGITQSNHRPSISAYTELRYNSSPTLQWYAGISGSSISFPNQAALEMDFYGGVRPTFGPLALDLGFIYYYYPKGTCFAGATNGLGQPNNADCVANLPLPINGNVTKAKADFYEWYAKAVYTINDMWALGGNFFYTPSYANTGAEGEYLSGTLKFTAPSAWLPAGIGMYLSGEFGRQWLGTSDAFYGIAAGTAIFGGGGAVTGSNFAAGVNYADYNTWNVGGGFTWKVFTLDLRYSDTNMSTGDCNALTSDYTATGPSIGNVTAINPGGFGSKWCGSTFIAKLSADVTLGSLK